MADADLPLFCSSSSQPAQRWGPALQGGFSRRRSFLVWLRGGLFGQLAHFVFPDITATPAAYAMIGMGAVVAGTNPRAGDRHSYVV